MIRGLIKKTKQNNFKRNFDDTDKKKGKTIWTNRSPLGWKFLSLPFLYSKRQREKCP